MLMTHIHVKGKLGYFLFLTNKLMFPPSPVPHSWSLRSGQCWHLFCPWQRFSLPLPPCPRSVWTICKGCCCITNTAQAQAPLIRNILKGNSKKTMLFKKFPVGFFCLSKITLLGGKKRKGYFNAFQPRSKITIFK